MKLSPGIYKVTMLQNGLFKTTHHLFVSQQDKQLYVGIDNGLPLRLDDALEFLADMRTENIKKLTNPLPVNWARIGIDWEDADGDHFEVSTMTDVYRLRDLFNLFPLVGQKLGAKVKPGRRK